MSIFEKLSKVDVSKHVKKKINLNYLSWAWAWSYVKSEYPSAKYSVKMFDGKPYIFDENLGYMVFTSVTIEGEIQEMCLPVMDGANKAQKIKSYEYTTKYGKKTCESATMFDINTAIQRCLTKNLALFGLGISLYAGEDISALFDNKIEEVEEVDLLDKMQLLYDELKPHLLESELEPIADMITNADSEGKQIGVVKFLESRIKEIVKQKKQVGENYDEVRKECNNILKEFIAKKQPTLDTPARVKDYIKKITKCESLSDIPVDKLKAFHKRIKEIYDKGNENGV